MKKSKTLIVGLIAALLALGTGVYIGMEARDAKEPESTLSTDVVSQFFSTRLNDETGKPHAIEQWRGKILVVNFWATWCQPCREEMPAFSRVQTKYAANGVQFVGIALDNSNNVTQFKKALSISYPLLIAENEGSTLTRQLGNSRLALPYTIVFGKAGEVRLTHLGQLSEQDLEKVLQAATSQ